MVEIKSRIWWIHDQRYMIKYQFKYKHPQEKGWVINEWIRNHSSRTDGLIIRTDEEEQNV